MIKRTFLHAEKRYEVYETMIKTALAPSLTLPKLSVLKEELESSLSSSFVLSEQDLKKWHLALQSLLLECAEQENPYTYCLLSCLQYMKVRRWQSLNPLQKLVVLSSLRSVMNNDEELRLKLEKQINLMLFFQEYQNLLKQVQQSCF